MHHGRDIHIGTQEGIEHFQCVGQRGIWVRQARQCGLQRRRPGAAQLGDLGNQARQILEQLAFKTYRFKRRQQAQCALVLAIAQQGILRHRSRPARQAVSA